MRLTLRTLLGYLDNILEPNDAEDIGNRIKESEVATSLLHRIRDVMRRLRLQAPNVEETRKDLDLNTVAEYLDHVLPDDRVPDFERICLESDVHLAEVASCHQILALVLGEPAEVDPKSRDHMYSLPEVVAELEAMEARQGAGPMGDNGRDGPPPPPRRPRPVVPDYLRESPGKRRRFPWAIALILLIGVSVIGLGVVIHLKPWGGGESEIATQGTSTNPSNNVANAPNGKEPAVTTEGATAPEEQEPVEPGPESVEPAVTSVPPLVEPIVPDQGNLPPVPDPVEATPNTTPGVPIEPETTNPKPEEKVPDESTPPALPESVMPTELVGPDKPETPGPRNMGRFMSDASEHQVLLLSDQEGQTWKRLPAQEILAAGNRLLALPAFRPLIALTSGITIHLQSGTLIDLDIVEGQESPRVEVKFGRLVINNVGTPETRLSLNLAGRLGTLTFVDPESRAAIEVTHALAAGGNPEKNPPEATVEIYALSGRLVWESDDGVSKVELKTASRLALDPSGAGLAEPVEQFPRWLEPGSASVRDRLASKTLEEAIQPDRPVTLGMKEQLEHRKWEVRWLAARSLGYVGDFKPLIAALDDPEQKLFWDDYIEELREAMVRGPVVAGQVRSALEEAYGAEDGLQVYRMLCGYTPEQLAGGQDLELVEALKHNLLIVRVVSFWNLREITGASLYYHPEEPLITRQKAVRQWEKRQKAGEIRMKAAARAGLSNPPSTVSSPTGSKEGAPSPTQPDGAQSPAVPLP